MPEHSNARCKKGSTSRIKKSRSGKEDIKECDEQDLLMLRHWLEPPEEYLVGSGDKSLNKATIQQVNIGIDSFHEGS